MAQQYADIVLYGGNILTANTQKPTDAWVAEAVAVSGQRILALGTNQEILKLVGPQTLKVDLEYKSIIPGRIDTQVPLNETTESEIFLAQGVTTVGAHLSNQSLGALQKLDSQGRLSVRVTYSVESSVQDVADSDMLWKNPIANRVENCAAIRKDQIAQAKETSVAFSCEPPLGVHLEDGTKLTDTEAQFGRQEGGDMRSPFRSMIDAGLRP